jgi:hypothetical protein
MTELLDTYPHHLAGGPARPPVQPADRIMAMAREAERRALADQPPPEELLAAVPPNWKLAPSLATLGDEANAVNPGRDKSSDGTIGDARHQTLGRDSDHNAWLVWQGTPWCRARDIDTSGLDVAAAFEHGRAKAAAGQLPQVLGGGYFIVFGRITAPDFKSWRTYKGSNPHLLAGHVSVSTDPARFTDRRPWGIFGGPTPPPPGPTPGPTPPPAPPGPGWTGPDLRGSGLGLRGEHGANGARVRALQAFLRATYPLYAKHLAADGWWGDKTTRVIREFGQRTGVRSADGRNIGPQLARKLYLAGFRG